MLIGITEIAQRLGMDRSTVFRWVQLGKLTPVQKLPGATGALLFTEDEYDRFVTERETPQDAA